MFNMRRRNIQQNISDLHRFTKKVACGFLTEDFDFQNY